jgi:hypothetical protein
MMVNIVQIILTANARKSLSQLRFFPFSANEVAS